MYFIAKYCPESIHTCLDHCIQLDRDCTYENPQWTLDFSFLSARGKFRSSEGKISLFRKFVQYGNKSDPSLSEQARKILMHPVSRGYIHRRWTELKWVFYIITMLAHFIYSLVFSVYAISVFRELCPLNVTTNYFSDEKVTAFVPSSITEHFSEVINCTLHDPEGQFKTRAQWALFAWICLIFFTVLSVGQQFLKFVEYKWRHFLELDALLHWFFIVMFALCSFHVSPFGGQPSVVWYQHHAAAWGVFSVWVQMLVIVGRTYQFGVYIILLKKVSVTVFKLILAYASLLIGFALTFYMLFPSHVDFNNDIPSIFVKVIIRSYWVLEMLCHVFSYSILLRFAGIASYSVF